MVHAKSDIVGCARVWNSKAANKAWSYTLICNYGSAFGNGTQVRKRPIYKTGRACSSCPNIRRRNKCGSKRYPALCGKVLIPPASPAIGASLSSYKNPGRLRVRRDYAHRTRGAKIQRAAQRDPDDDPDDSEPKNLAEPGTLDEPEHPDEPESLQIPDAPDAPDDSNVADHSAGPDDSDIPIPDTPEGSESLSIPEASEESETSSTASVPDDSGDYVDNSESPPNPDAPEDSFHARALPTSDDSDGDDSVGVDDSERLLSPDTSDDDESFSVPDDVDVSEKRGNGNANDNCVTTTTPAVECTTLPGPKRLANKTKSNNPGNDSDKFLGGAPRETQTASCFSGTYHIRKNSFVLVVSLHISLLFY